MSKELKSLLFVSFLILFSVPILFGMVAVIPVLAAPASHGVQLANQVQEIPPVPAVAELNAEFLFFLVSLTGFIKIRFGVKGNLVYVIAFVVGLLLYLYPLLIPDSGTIVSSIVEFVKWFVGGLGSYDTAVDAGSKMVQFGNKNLYGPAKAAAIETGIK